MKMSKDAIYEGKTGLAFDVMLHDPIGLGSLAFVFGGVDASVQNRDGKLVVCCECEGEYDTKEASVLAEQIIQSLKDHYVKGEVVPKCKTRKRPTGEIISHDADPMESWAWDRDRG
jgi:hypothetical protein